MMKLEGSQLGYRMDLGVALDGADEKDGNPGKSASVRVKPLRRHFKSSGGKRKMIVEVARVLRVRNLVLQCRSASVNIPQACYLAQQDFMIT